MCIRDRLKAAIEKNELEEIRTKKDALNEIVQALSMKLYEEAAKKQASSTGRAEQAPPPESDESNVKRKKDGDDVIDAEFEAKDR